MPQGRKRPMINFANLELNELRLAEEFRITAPKKLKEVKLLDINDWI